MIVTKTIRSYAAAMLAALLLSGCFASRQPLITPETADFPFPDGSKIVDYANCASPGGKLLGCKGYKRTGSVVLAVEKGAYMVRPAPGESPANLPGAPPGEQDMPILIKALGGNLFAAQLVIVDTPTPGGIQYIYEMLRITGNTVYVYALECEQNGDQAYVKAGTLAAISSELLVPTCEVTSLPALAKIFHDRLANGAIPDRKLEVQPHK